MLFRTSVTNIAEHGQPMTTTQITASSAVPRRPPTPGSRSLASASSTRYRARKRGGLMMAPAAISGRYGLVVLLVRQRGRRFVRVLPTLVEDLLDVVGRPYDGIDHVVLIILRCLRESPQGGRVG